jgi:ribonucleoside-diphosphate reductase alpha chain
MDMRANDHGWLALKLESLAKTPGDEGFEMPFPPHGERKRMPSVVAAMAQLIQHRVEQLGAFKPRRPDAGARRHVQPKEPKTGTDGTLSWTVDVFNPATGEDFVLGLKEITLPDGVTRPYSVWLSGNYPRALDGLTKLLSLDMRVLDPAWIGMKLRKLLDYPEPLGDFMAFVPGTRKQTNYPSTVAYLAQPDHPPLRDARHPRRKRPAAAADGHPAAPAGSTAAKPTAGQAVRRVRQPDDDPEGWL